MAKKTVTKTVSANNVYTVTLYVAFNGENLSYNDIDLALRQGDMREQVENYIRQHSKLNVYGLKLNAKPDGQVDADSDKGAAFKRVHDAHSKRCTSVSPDDIELSDSFGKFAEQLGASERVKRAAQDGASSDKFQKLAYLMGAGLSEEDAKAVLDMMK